jgi:hypothetical protein
MGRGSRSSAVKSTTATKVAPRRVKLSDQERDWSYAYLEIVQRTEGFDVFVPQQARKLFDMTKR